MRDFVKEFLNVKAVESGVSLNTIKAYAGDISQFIEAIEPVLPQNAQKADIELFLNFKELDDIPLDTK